jgi:hypothetical protein
MSYLVYGATLIVGILLEEAVRPTAENHPVVVGLVLGAVALVTLVPVLFLFGAATAGPLVLVIGGCAWGWIAGWDNRDNYLTPFCEYGATSRGQIERCLDDVNSEDIDRLDTPAARFARGEITKCGADAGPFCKD